MHVELRPDITWVGAIDWSVRDFHGYQTDRGTTYNAYLVRDTQNALIDAVKAEFVEQLLRHVADGLGGEPGSTSGPSLDYVVCNHAEPDHSGGLPELLRAYPKAKLVCNAKCRDALAMHFDTSIWTFHLVKEGDTLGLGRRTVRFIQTPMVHWPESMFTYVPEEKLLFSMDAFGQHYAASPRFDDETPPGTALDEAKTYYANIVMPYGKSVVTCLDRLADVPVDMIAPSHGVIWRSHVADIVGAYRDWSICRPRAKVLVIYDTMWESTRRMAEAIHEGAWQPGIDVQLIALRRSNLTQIAANVLDAAAVAFGSPTLNRCPMPEVAATVSYLQGLRPTGKAALAFGSYGWGSVGAEFLDTGMRSLDWEMIGPPIKSKYRPTPEILDQCRAAGVELARRALQLAGGGSAASSADY